MNITKQKIENLIHNLLIVYSVLIYGFLAVITIISYKLEIPILKLWKEGFLIIIFSISFMKNIVFKSKKGKKDNLEKLILILLLIIFIMNLFNTNIFLILYQIKLELPLLFIYIFYSMKDYYTNSPQKKKKLLEIIICVAILNVLCSIFESLYPYLIVKEILKIPFNAKSSGVITNFAGGRFRTFGLLQNYSQFADYVFFIFLILNERKILKNKYLQIIIALFMLLAIYLSTYKTVYLGICIYIFLKLLQKLKLSKFFKSLVLIFIFIGNLISITTYGLYNFLKFDLGIKSNYIESSLAGRIGAYKIIMNQLLEKKENFLLGLGMGKQGDLDFLVSIDKVSERIALDSVLLSCVSNYGVIFSFLVLFFLLIKLWKEKDTLRKSVYAYILIAGIPMNNFYYNPSTMFLIGFILNIL